MVHRGLVLCTFFCAAITLCSTGCGQLLDNYVCDADKGIIVNKHNHLRALIARGRVPRQPRGIDLRPLKWDDRLAQEAQRIANACAFEHARVRDGRFAVGQNLGWRGGRDGSPGTDWPGVIQRWFDEHRDFAYPGTARSRGMTGHYTQVVWADTYLIGCGFSWYRKHHRYEKLYVCNYGPAGNCVGQAPYEV